VGRFVEKKGLPDLFAAMRRLWASGSDLSLSLIGDGPLAPFVEAQIAAGGPIRWLGWKDQAGVRAALAEARVAVAPSRTAANGDCEGLPSVLYEAAAIGAPIVATAHSGAPEAVTDGVSGRLTPECDPAALAEAIATVAADDALAKRFAAAARKDAETRLDARTSAAALDAAFDRAAEKPIARPRRSARPPQRILVIRLGALGDVIQCVGAFQTIRAAHPDAEIDALTQPAFAELVQMSGLFSTVHAPPKPRSVRTWLQMIQALRAADYDRVYDLQRNDRTAVLFHGMRFASRLEWSGVFRGASHRSIENKNSDQHGAEKIAIQLQIAGLRKPALSDLSFLDGPIDALQLPIPFALLTPGAAPNRPRKRWPAERFAVLAERLRDRGVASAVVGGPDDAAVCAEAARSGATNLCGRTDLGQLAALGRRARIAVGGDTGPMHLFSTVGCPVLSLYGDDSEPSRTRPLGQDVHVLRGETMSALDVETVWNALSACLDQVERSAPSAP
ncbi:MAG: glycosyltransferase family 9 protein, partial [Pseudomonadota bacterium]